MGAAIVEARYAELEALAGRFGRAEGQMQALASGVAQRADVLRRGGWEGHGKDAFTAEMDGVVTPALARLIGALGEANEVTRRMSEVMAAAEDEAAALFRTVKGGDVYAGGSAVEIPGPTDIEDFDGVIASMSAAGLVIGPALVSFLDFVAERSKDRRATQAALREIGRLLNRYLGTTGYVGKMDDLYRTLVVKGIPHRGSIATMLKSGGFVAFLTVADAAFGAIDDWNKGEYGGDLLKIGGVNLGDATLQLVLGATPPGRIALIVNSANQLVGSAEVWGMNQYTDHAAANNDMRVMLKHDADSMAVAYKKMDITNITKELAEGVWDGYREALTPHRNIAQAYLTAFNDVQRDPSLATMGRVMDNVSQVMRDNAADYIISSVTMPLGLPLLTTDGGRRGLTDALKATGNVVDGFVDSQVIRQGNRINMGMNDIQNAVKRMPISDGLKQGISNAALGTARMNQTAGQWATGLINF